MKSRLLLLVVTLIAGCVAIEVYFRATYRPVFDFSRFVSYGKDAFVVPLNAAGFRQQPIPTAAFEPGATRILFLGDSFTFGHGIKEADRFTDILQSRLGERAFIYNGGQSGTEPTRWVEYLKTLIPTYRPRIVVAVFFLRDGTPMCSSLVCHTAKIKELQAEHDGIAYRHSYTFRALADRRIADAFNAYYSGLMRNSYLGSDAERVTWRKEQASLLRLAEICRQNAMDFHLVIFPALLNLKNYPYDDVEAEIASFAQRNGIPAYSLLPAFRGQRERDLWLSDGDQHPNEKGNRIAAEALEPYINSLLKKTCVGLSCLPQAVTPTRAPG
jgi:lysophospholipase L1-like esterase